MNTPITKEQERDGMTYEEACRWLDIPEDCNSVALSLWALFTHAKNDRIPADRIRLFRRNNDLA